MPTGPSDHRPSRTPYALALQRALHEAGIAWPVIVVDRARLDANVDVVTRHLPDGMGLRLVAKSLPSVELLAHVRRRAGTDRLMTFNQPMLTALSIAMPDADQLLGKPLPVGAARAYLESLPDVSVARRVQWLIDTPARLGQYAGLARELGVDLRIALELDVGLHRGGLVPGPALDATLRGIADDDRLTLSGVVGYEPHVPHIPDVLGWRDRALRRAWRTYRSVLDRVSQVLGGQVVGDLTRNAGGSLTYRCYTDTSVADEVSVGSALVKPSDFDLDGLTDHVPAAFIATPVLKVQPTRIPGLEAAAPLLGRLAPGDTTSVFIHGGNWLADPVDPPGLAPHRLVGRSSNQEMLTGGPDLDLAVDDVVLLRPRQSEAVLLHFGDLVVVEGGAVVDRWPVLPASA